MWAAREASDERAPAVHTAGPTGGRHGERVVNVKGTAVRSRLEFLRETLGLDGLQAVLEAFPEEERWALAAALPSAWVPVELLDRLDLEIVRHGGGLQLASEYGAFSARRHLTNVYEAFFDQAEGEPRRLVEGLAALHRSFYDEGGMRVRDQKRGSCRIELDFAGRAARFRCQVSRGFVEEALRMIEAQDLRVQETGCQTRGDAHCAFAVRWNPDATMRPSVPDAAVVGPVSAPPIHHRRAR